MKRLQIDSRGRLSHGGKKVVARALGKPRLTLGITRDDALDYLIGISPKEADSFVVGSDKIPVNIWPNFHPKYGTCELYVPVQFYRIKREK